MVVTLLLSRRLVEAEMVCDVTRRVWRRAICTSLSSLSEVSAFDVIGGRGLLASEGKMQSNGGMQVQEKGYQGLKLLEKK